MTAYGMQFAPSAAHTGAGWTFEKTRSGAESQELLSVFGQWHRTECFRISTARIQQANRAVRIQAQTGVQIIGLLELTRIMRECLTLQLYRRIDAHQTIGKEGRPNLITHTLKIPRGARRRREQDFRGCAMIPVLLEKVRQIDQLGSAPLQKRA